MHVSYSDIVTAIADEGWGREFESKEVAVKEIIQDKQMLNAFAMLELVKRFNAIGQACGSKKVVTHDRAIRPDGSEPTFPSKEVGDRFYSGDLDDGFREFIVIAKDDEHHCMVVPLNEFDLDYPPQARIASDWHQETKADAVRKAAECDVRYHGGRSENAKAALAAAISGEDVSQFMDGYKEPEEDETTSA